MKTQLMTYASPLRERLEEHESCAPKVKFNSLHDMTSIQIENTFVIYSSVTKTFVDNLDCQ